MKNKQKNTAPKLVVPSSSGLSASTRAAHAKAVGEVLASTYILMLKTHNYHWNVAGPYFSSLHSLFQAQYEALFEAVDELAERIRALGAKAPGSFTEFSKISIVKEDSTAPKNWEVMVKNLLNDHETLARRLHDIISEAADAGDDATADLLTNRLDEHEKTAWMLRAHFEA
jgi:starvation-inducible DNA-binding protein